ncbi:hypothetical protein [Bradyrhizobium liaoningense]|uniref:hypothetical protein n=1 Tax=Bradyrhizobium liaoningense TaxID=43992 RepID=UPI001BA6DD90|nr:hypothetical protein [Bradyrhizobium liaoningense]MBR0941012.1 hypothetical protein [Bradyrhizobium liaoningense]
MSDIPQARNRLDDVIRYADLDEPTQHELKAIRGLLGRERASFRAPISSVKLTPSVKDKILELKRRSPSMTEQDIASAVNVDIGRVSETLSRGARWRYDGI